jgi:hypothetical protein
MRLRLRRIQMLGQMVRASNLGRMVSHEAERQLLARYLSLLDEFRAASMLSGARRNAARELKQIAPGVRRILYAVGPDLGGRPHGKFIDDHLASQQTVARALRLLTTQDEWEKSQNPDNPVLPATELHPVVWAPARACGSPECTARRCTRQPTRSTTSHNASWDAATCQT